MMLSASCNADGVVNGSHDQTHQVAHHFSCLDLRKTMVPLMMLLVSSNTDAGANSIA